MTRPLNKNRDFKRLYGKGKSSVGGCMVVYCRPNRLSVMRLGITVSTKLGCAVRRNRMRRRLRESYRLLEGRLDTNYDICLVARAHSFDAPFERLMREMLSHFTRLGIIKDVK